MGQIGKKKPTVQKARMNIANSIDEAARRISASLAKDPARTGWDEERIDNLRTCDGKVGEIPIDIIRTNQNIRKRFDEDSPQFKELVESIKTHGVLQPPIVTVVTNENERSSILLVGGERRLKAALKAGYQSINCLVRIFDSPSTRLTASMAENMNRKDLECLDVAHCYLSLHQQGYRYSEIQRMFGRDEKTIGRYIKMAKWPLRIQEKIRDNNAKFSARFLLAIASKTLSEAEVERAIDQRIDQSNAPKPLTKTKGKTTMNRFVSYCDANKLKKHERDLILNALVDLGIIAAKGPDHAGRTLRGASAHATRPGTFAS
jgi:ParB family chromosome partitioning protein